MSEYKELGKGVVKRRQKRVLGLFIDGTGLDRATRRLNRRVEMSNLIKGVTSGLTPVVARYYTLIPYEDDSRQRAFLDAVYRAGLTVVVKRLPPKGVTRQVSVDSEMAADIVAFAMGHTNFGDLMKYSPSLDGETAKPAAGPVGMKPFQRQLSVRPDSGDQNNDVTSEKTKAGGESVKSTAEQRILTVVCPGRDLAYPISLANELGVDTINADFGKFNSGDVLKSAAKWIDLSDSETIWRE